MLIMEREVVRSVQRISTSIRSSIVLGLAAGLAIYASYVNNAKPLLNIFISVQKLYSCGYNFNNAPIRSLMFLNFPPVRTAAD